MRLTRALFLALSLSLLSGCVATQQNINLDMQNVAEEPEQNDDTGILCLIKPADGPIFSDYGVRRRTRNQKPRFHAGIDIAAKRGSDVVAAAGGTVVFSGRKNGYGKTVKIDHGKYRVTLYAHMDKVFVTEGQTLAQGERLGLVGRTGRTTGPHLHFELRVEGQHTNPVPDGGWTDPDLTIATAAAPAEVAAPVAGAKAIVPSVATAINTVTGSVKTAEVDAPEALDKLDAAPVAKPTNPILAFFRKHARPADAEQTAENDPQQPAS